MCYSIMFQCARLVSSSLGQYASVLLNKLKYVDEYFKDKF